MEYIPEQRDYSVPDFYREFGGTLPKLVMVSKGYHSDVIADRFRPGQVLRLHTVSRQTRVVVHTTLDGKPRLLSMPVTFQDNLCVVKADGQLEKQLPLSQILRKHPMPVTVFFPKHQSLSVSGQTISTIRLTPFKVTQQYEEMYLLGNAVIEGKCSENILDIPLYFEQLRFAFITGVKWYSKLQWSSHLQDLAKACEYLEYDMEFGRPDITVYNPKYTFEDHSEIYNVPREGDVSIDGYINSQGLNLSFIDNKHVPKKRPPAPLPKPNSVLRKSRGDFEPTAHQVARSPSNLATPNTTPVCPLDDEPVYVNDIPEVPLAAGECIIVASLSITQVSEYLHRLKLDKYVNDFRKQMIDGYLLTQLDLDLLKGDFGLSGIETIRLKTFARSGHIPH